MARPGVGVAGQFCGPLHHLLRRVTVLTCQWPPLRARLWLWLHTHPFRRMPDQHGQPLLYWPGPDRHMDKVWPSA
jgi:hypothetical protein